MDTFLGPEHCPCNPSLLTYRLVGDNIDKNVRPRNMTSQHQVRSLHYFHSYAVRDRIDLSDASSEIPTLSMCEMRVEDLLPSEDDHLVLCKNMAILMGRILRKYMPFFTKFATGLGRHIFHEHYEDLSTKSHVVSCWYARATSCFVMLCKYVLTNPISFSNVGSTGYMFEE